MRMLLKAQMDVEAGNRAINEGRLPEILQEVMARVEPEAAYFGTLEGMRTAFIVFDLKDPSDIPSIAEPLFMGTHAKLDLIPVMTRDDLKAGLARMSGGATAGVPGD